MVLRKKSCPWVWEKILDIKENSLRLLQVNCILVSLKSDWPYSVSFHWHTEDFFRISSWCTVVQWLLHHTELCKEPGLRLWNHACSTEGTFELLISLFLFTIQIFLSIERRWINIYLMNRKGLRGSKFKFEIKSTYASRCKFLGTLPKF